MIRRRRQARFAVASGAAGSDIDALQTDVMRFMAIIGLCLMAVFALVQVIPAQEPDKPAQPVQDARVQQEIMAQQQQLRELQAELIALKAEKQRTQQLLNIAQHQFEQIAGQTRQSREQRDRLESQLEVLDRRLEKERRVLADIEQDSRRKKQNLGELRGRLLKTRAQLDRSRKEIAAIKQQSRKESDMPVIKQQSPQEPEIPVMKQQSRQEPDMPVIKHQSSQEPDMPVIKQQSSQEPDMPVIRQQSLADPEPESVPDKQGFSLRFASDAALNRLVAADRVTLYGMINQQAWRLSMDADGPAVVRVAFPEWFHEMSAATVPAHYIHSLENFADTPGRSIVVWGVQLPSATKTAIASLIQGRQGGELVIQDDGQVLLEE